MSKRRKPVEIPSNKLYRLHITDIYKYFIAQKMSFICLCIYSFLEYVRPQAIYPILKGLPLTTGFLLLTIGFYFFEGPKSRKLTSLDYWLGLFTVIMIAASVTAVDPSISYAFLRPYYIEWLVVILLTAAIVNTESRFFVFMLFWIMWSFKMSQHGVREWSGRGFSFAGYGISCAPQFFQNSGECGIQMAVFFPIALYFYLGIRMFLTRKRRIFMAIIPATAAITIMASSSRGAQLALLAVLLWIVLRSKQRVKSLIYGAVAISALYAILPAEQMERFNTMGQDDTSVRRKQYWHDGLIIMSEYPILGIGPDNWLAYYRANYNPKGEVQHNIFVEAGSELGYTGLGVFVAMIICTFTLNYKTRKIASVLDREDGEHDLLWYMAHGFDGALVGYMVSGFFVTVLFYPFFWTNVSMTLALHNVTRWRVRKFKREQAALPVDSAVHVMEPVRQLRGWQPRGHAT